MKDEHTVATKIVRNCRILKNVIVIYCELEYTDGIIIPSKVPMYERTIQVNLQQLFMPMSVEL